eukprot:5877572-Amphidinium_carterae.1
MLLTIYGTVVELYGVVGRPEVSKTSLGEPLADTSAVLRSTRMAVAALSLSSEHRYPCATAAVIYEGGRVTLLLAAICVPCLPDLCLIARRAGSRGPQIQSDCRVPNAFTWMTC